LGLTRVENATFISLGLAPTRVEEAAFSTRAEEANL